MSRKIRVTVEEIPEGKGKILKWGTIAEIPADLAGREQLGANLSEVMVRTIAAVMKR